MQAAATEEHDTVAQQELQWVPKTIPAVERC